MVEKIEIGKYYLDEENRRIVHPLEKRDGLEFPMKCIEYHFNGIVRNNNWKEYIINLVLKEITKVETYKYLIWKNKMKFEINDILYFELPSFTVHDYKNVSIVKFINDNFMELEIIWENSPEYDIRFSTWFFFFDKTVAFKIKKLDKLEAQKYLI